MNERIDQLWGQALDAAVPETYTKLSYSQVLKIKQVFAKLIIKECIYCAQFVGITNDRIGLGPMPIRYTSMVNDQIKKHFGVEE